jgi:Zn-dependent protease
MNFDFLKNIDLLLIQAPVILLSLTVHEYFHGWTANKLGDPTAKMQGRLTLNPIAHLDILGTILMFAVGFGWAKPVPIDPRNFKDPKKDTILVAIAGPLSNLVMALAAGLALRYMIPKMVSGEISSEGIYPVIAIILILTLVYGIALAVFNMIPIPPLDGSRVLYGILPNRYAYAYSRFEPYGVLFLFALFIFGGGVFKYLLVPLSYISVMLSGYNYSTLWGIISALLK